MTCSLGSVRAGRCRPRSHCVFPKAARPARAGTGTPPADLVRRSLCARARAEPVARSHHQYIEAMDPDARAVMNRMKVLCRLACNSAAACLVFVAVDALAGRPPDLDRAADRDDGCDPVAGAGRGGLSRTPASADPVVDLAAVADRGGRRSRTLRCVAPAHSLGCHRNNQRLPLLVFSSCQAKAPVVLAASCNVRKWPQSSTSATRSPSVALIAWSA